MTGQRVAQQKNSPGRWGRPFARAPREICPAILTHPHWGGDCITTMRRLDAGAGPANSLHASAYYSEYNEGSDLKYYFFVKSIIYVVCSFTITD